MASTGFVTFTLCLPAVFEQEGSLVLGHFPTIDVSSQGRDRAEAERNLVEAAQLFVESCFERNVLDEVLKACGFKPSHLQSRPGLDYLSVPVELLAARDGSASLAG
jgi:predicted RNase H-like HicB family nuclease